MHRRSFWIVVLTFALVASSRADGPDDNKADHVRRMPPPGVAIGESDREQLTKESAELGQQIEGLRRLLADKPDALDLLPDVEIYHKAVDWALRFDEFYSTNQVAVARDLLREGRERAAWLQQGMAPWNKLTGLVVRGYRSRIDGSVQPYGLVVPDAFAVSSGQPLRLDFWFHGRGEKLTELDFIQQRSKSPGEFTPPNTMVLHLYGRYCNANKFAGEVDLFEALADVKKHYPIDENRLVVRGFSMGGASCWQFATHYAGLWAAAAPGAGFAETPEFLNVFQNETLQPAWWEQKLWHLYNSTDYALNLFNCPTVAYSGEIDRQKQAADIMTKALAAEGMTLTHIIGKSMGHRYSPEAKVEISKRIDAIAAEGRDPLPREVKFTTFTLRYNRMKWVVLEGLEKHWERALVTARIVGDHRVEVTTTNVTHIAFEMPAGLCSLDQMRLPEVLIDGQTLAGNPVMSDRSWQSRYRKVDGRWRSYEESDDLAARKRPGLQGPIDDAFMDSFLIVRPTGQPKNEKVGAWVKEEAEHAVEQWRRQFRGELRVVNDTELTPDDIASNNLVLFGDPQSNQVLKKFYDVLPVSWRGNEIVAGAERFDATNHILTSVTPNPLNPRHYVVLNSGFTFREYDQLNNARQVPKLPDWAIIDIDAPVTSRVPGKVVAAGFFDENWQLSKN